MINKTKSNKKLVLTFPRNTNSKNISNNNINNSDKNIENKNLIKNIGSSDFHVGGNNEDDSRYYTWSDVKTKNDKEFIKLIIQLNINELTGLYRDIQRAYRLTEQKERKEYIMHRINLLMQNIPEQSRLALNSRTNNSDDSDADNGERESKILIAIGMTGVGKTYAIIGEIKAYLEQPNKRAVFIFDTNGEPQYAKEFPKAINLNQLHTVQRGECVRVRPLNPSGDVMSDSEMRWTSVYMVNNCKNCLLVFDDIDNYYRGSKGREISKLFTSHRHRSQDVIITHQALAPIQTIEWQNLHVIRLHKTTNSVEVIKDRVTNYDLIKIAELIVQEQHMLAEETYNEGNLSKKEYAIRKSYFVYADMRRNKIIGNFSLECFIRNTKKFINMKPNAIRNYMITNSKDGVPVMSQQEALSKMLKEYKMLYFEGKD